eukprot:6466339-Amphidinium_carterae.1
MAADKAWPWCRMRHFLLPISSLSSSTRMHASSGDPSPKLPKKDWMIPSLTDPSLFKFGTPRTGTPNMPQCYIQYTV